MSISASTATTAAGQPGTAGDAPGAWTVEAPTAGAPTMETLMVEALGSVIGVAGLSSDEAAEFRQAWNRCLAEPGSIAAATVQRIPGDFARANESLTSAITLAAIEQLAGTCMMFHACGLADPRTGATIAFIAPSGTGKTTMARTLGPELGYVSDETIAVHADLSIVSYPKPLSVKQSEPGRPKLQQGPEHHSLGATPAEPVLSAITLLTRTPGDTAVTVEAVPLGQAILELTPQLSALARLERGLVQLCTMIQACGGVKRIRYSEAAGIAALLPELAGPAPADPPAAGQEPEWAALETTPGTAPRTETTQGGLRRTTVQDAVEVGGTVFLLVDSQVIELGPLGSLIWEITRDWSAREAILEQVVEAIDAHPSAEELIDAALAELLSRGVLEQA